MGKTDCTTLSIFAMATRFELILCGDNETRLRAAGEEVMDEITRLDSQMSLYRTESEIVLLNSQAAQRPVKLDPRLFRLLYQAASTSAATDLAFDITVTPLMRAWGLAGGRGRVPDAEEIERALSVVGVQHILFDSSDYSIKFNCPGIEIDLGAIGKGYAVESAVEMLRENGVQSAFIHGGTSTAYGIGTQPNSAPWRVAVADPTNPDNNLDTVELTNSALAVSAIHGKSFIDGEHEYGHVIDPRTGQPVSHTLLAAVTGPSPTLCDALSTALMVLGEEWLPALNNRFAGYSGLVAVPESDRIRVVKSSSA